MDKRSRYRGCLLGGAMGDALGAAVEFESFDEIHRRFGPSGIQTYAPAYGRTGAITDDTQMTLFTAEGLIRALVRQRHKGTASYASVTGNAYLRWLLTQGYSNDHKIDPLEINPGWLYSQQDLHARRAPGTTCLTALSKTREPGKNAENDSKGCGGVMRVAPAGLFAESEEEAFELGCELAALTHGHPTGWLAGGALAAMINMLLRGSPLPDSVEAALVYLERRPDHKETTHALRLATDLAADSTAPEQAIARLGEGWIAEEALAISVYCAMTAPDFRQGVITAVNHGGDSDSTGAITGNLLGCIGGEACLPQDWLRGLELRDVITELADDLIDCRGWNIGHGALDGDFDKRIWEKYPG
jgi:ADP-ribosylglycohydrolase